MGLDTSMSYCKKHQKYYNIFICQCPDCAKEKKLIGVPNQHMESCTDNKYKDARGDVVSSGYF